MQKLNDLSRSLTALEPGSTLIAVVGALIGHDDRAPLRGRCFLEGLIALGEGDPGLFAPRPDVTGRSQPGRIIERTRPNTCQPIPRRAGDPRPTLGTNPSRITPLSPWRGKHVPPAAKGREAL